VIVLDASVLANVVGDDGPGGRAARSLLASAGDAAIPELADVETAAVLRKRWLAGMLADARLAAALGDLVALPLRRFPARPFLRRAFDLRATVTAYDAIYVALAESLECELVTADARLARAPGVRCPVRVVRDPA